MVRLFNSDTNFFNIVVGISHGDTLVPYMFIFCRDYVLQTPKDLRKENGFALKKTWSRRYPVQTMRDAVYGYLTLLENTSAQVESQLHRLGQAVRGIGFNFNLNKTEFMCFKQKRDITLIC